MVELNLGMFRLLFLKPLHAYSHWHSPLDGTRSAKPFSVHLSVCYALLASFALALALLGVMTVQEKTDCRLLLKALLEHEQALLGVMTVQEQTDCRLLLKAFLEHEQAVVAMGQAAFFQLQRQALMQRCWSESDRILAIAALGT